MKNRTIQLGLCAVFLLHLAAPIEAQVHSEHQQKIKLSKHDATIDIEVNGKPFSTYHFADDFLYPAVRPYFWPVLASDGVEVTIDQAQHKELRPYQRSIWIGAGDVNGADHWKFKAVPLPKQRHIRFLWVHHNGFATPEYGKGDPRRKAGDFTIRMGATATFRYEILIHQGTATAAHISDRYAEFAVSREQ